MIVMERTMGLSFGDVVRRRREEMGWSQTDLAVRLARIDPEGWARRDATRVSKVETGHTMRRLPDAEEFRVWAEALEMEPSVILERMGYLGSYALDDPSRPVELVFTSLADEVRGNRELPSDVQETVLDGLKHARRLWEAKYGRNN